LAITESQIYDLAARRGRLEAERNGADQIAFGTDLLEAAKSNPEVADILATNQSLFAQRRDNLAASIAQLEKRKDQIASQIDGLSAQLDAQQEQVALIEVELANQQSLLDKGLTQSSTVLTLKRQKAQLAGSVGDIIARKAQSAERITEIELQILQLQSQRQEEASSLLSDQEGKELQLAENRRSLLEQLDRLDIRAPLAGAVHDMQVFSVGAVIRPAETVLAIVPQDQPLIIGAQVPIIHIDQAHVGQSVRLRFPAFSSRTTPELFGHVISVSPDALHDPNTGRSYYRARIEIDENEIANLPTGSVLIPGMPVEAFLSTGERSPLAYLMKPFTDYFSKAFRED
ncbi:MAG: HlyD family type I secretion periplasmic adaptor subunit, partial [Maritimibacter sp.]